MYNVVGDSAVTMTVVSQTNEVEACPADVSLYPEAGQETFEVWKKKGAGNNEPPIVSLTKTANQYIVPSTLQFMLLIAFHDICNLLHKDVLQLIREVV